MSYWELTEDEQDLAEHVYYETKGKIYINKNGDLHESYSSSSEEVDSRDCYAFDIFVGEIENAKIRAHDKMSRR